MKYNLCPICDYDSGYIEKKGHYDQFRCFGCGVKFQETGTGPEVIAGEFEVDHIYYGFYWPAGVKMPVCILIKNRFRRFGEIVYVNVVGCGVELDRMEPYIELKIKRKGDAEYIEIGGVAIWAHNSGG